MTRGQGYSFAGEYDILDLAYQIGSWRGGLIIERTHYELNPFPDADDKRWKENDRAASV